jgi:uncharacterized protein YcbK (DUF882 family)
MFQRTHMTPGLPLPRLLGGLLVLATFVPWILPVSPAHSSTARAEAPAPWFAWPSARVPSPGELALEGRLQTEALPPRDRLVAMENMSTGEKATFHVGAGGYVRSDQLGELEYFFRCRRTQRKGPIDRRLVEVLAQVSQHWPGRVIEFLSGFRVFPNGAPKSRHYIGHALDLRVRGVPSTQVRDYVWGAFRGLGVGHYPEENFVHIDTRADAPEMAWSGHDEATRLIYNPLWASRGHAPSAEIDPGFDH